MHAKLKQNIEILGSYADGPVRQTYQHTYMGYMVIGVEGLR
jgi:hypothetical protein